jgi:hypothetical protein
MYPTEVKFILEGNLPPIFTANESYIFELMSPQFVDLKVLTDEDVPSLPVHPLI